MLTHLFRRALFILFLLGLAACKPTYTITNPVKDSVNTTPPPLYRFTYSTQPQKLPAITLNGTRVETYFAMTATEATANGADIAQFLREGKNRFQVDPPLGPMVSFIYDTVGPEIVVSQADANTPATIKGLAVDAVGVKSLLVNGVSTTVSSDGSFSATVDPADIYTFDAVDNLNHVSQTQYTRYGTNYNPSVRMRINQSGINFATSKIINVLNGLDLNKQVAGRKLYDNTWTGPSGETYGADGFIDSLSISASAFNLNLGNGGNSSFNGTLTTAHAVLRLQLHNGLLPPTVIMVGANIGPLDFSGNLNAQAINHQPVITLSNFDFNIGNVAVDNVPSVFQAMLSPTIAGLTNLFSGEIGETLSGVLNSALPGIFAEIIQNSYTIQINEMKLAVVAQLEDITISDNSLLVTLSGGVTPINPSALIPQPLGPVYTPDTVPEPPIGGTDLGIDVNTNVINQTLVSAYAVGMTHMDIQGSNTYLGLPRDDSRGAEGASRMLVDTLTPPQIHVTEGADGHAKTTLSIRSLKISSQHKSNGVYVNDFTADVNAKVAISISVKADNTLDIIFVSSPEVTINGIAIGSNLVFTDAANDIVENFVSLGIGAIMEQLAKPLQGIKLPSFACIAFQPGSFDAVGENNTHVQMTGSLFKTSTDCDHPAAEPPKVAYGRGVGSPLICGLGEQYDAGLCYQPCNTGYHGVGPVCWKDNASYGRGVGSAASLGCGANEDLDAGLCYPKCKSGFHGVGPVCWNDSAQSYGRGVGTIPNLIPYGCPSGKVMDAGLCYVPCNSGYHGVGPVCWLDEGSYGRGVGAVASLVCGSNQDLDAGLCYNKCDAGYHGVGPVCWTNDALSYGRGVGTPVHACPEGKEEDTGLCYNLCAAGYNGVGPVCWPQ